jgi:hypothetical protein
MKHATSTTGPSEEERILAAVQTAIAAGKDPFGDMDDDDDSLAAAEIAEAEIAEADGVEAEGEQDEKATDVAEDDAAEDGKARSKADLSPDALEAPTAAPQTKLSRGYKTSTLDELKAQRAEQMELHGRAMRDLMDGVIEADAYSAINAAVMEKLDALTTQRTLLEANAQNEAQAQEDALGAIILEAGKAGIDYAQPGFAKQFDIALAMLQAGDPKIPFAEHAQQAHQHVMALNGKAPAAAADSTNSEKPTIAAIARQNGKAPVTLRTIPAAAVPNTGGDWRDAMVKLNGQDYEAAFAALSPAQRASLLND